MKHRGLLVPVEGEIREFWYDGYKDIQAAIGCDMFCSVPWLFGDEPACYVDDEGKLKGAMPNRAVYSNGELVDVLFGNIVFCGIDMETGEDRDITDWEIERVVRRFSTHPEEEGSGMRAVTSIRRTFDANEAKGRLKSHGKL